MPEKNIYIYGAGGLGREILSLLRSTGDWRVLGFIDDSVAKGSEVSGVRVLGGREVLDDLKGSCYLVLGIGDPKAKAQLAKTIANPNIIFPVITHASVIIQDPDTIALGEGTVITAGCVLTTGINVGKHVLLNLNTTVGHDVHIGDFTSVMPGANIAGEVIVGGCVLIGSGANIKNRMVISDNSRVGMGAVVTRPVPPNTTVVGVPAKPVTK